MRLYEAVYGSAVLGNGEASNAVRYPDQTLTDRVKVDHPYLKDTALNMIMTNVLWQRAVGRLSALGVAELTSLGKFPENKIKSMLSCPLPGVRLSNQPKRSYACRHFMCPNCHYRKLVRAYKMFAQYTEPGTLLYEYTLNVYSPENRMISESMVQEVNRLMTMWTNQRRFDWRYGINLTMPVWQSATKFRNSMWKCTSRTLATAGMDTRIATGELGWERSPKTNDVYDEQCTCIGEANPKTVLAALANAYRYPAALLYNTTTGIDLYEMHKYFYNEKSGHPECRSRTYGIKRKDFELVEKGSIDVKNPEQCISWRPPFETSDVDEPAGDQERCVRLIGTDNRVLCCQ